MKIWLDDIRLVEINDKKGGVGYERRNKRI